MSPFLSTVAADLFQKYEGHMQELVVVFPNKRASLFMNQHLFRLNGQRPLWSPRYTTISELFSQLSPLVVADPILLVCLLHQAYTQVTGSDTTLDRFYSWGELMLADFDDIDNNMADARQLFRNIRDLADLTDYSFLNEAQERALKEYFRNYEPGKQTRLKEKFEATWNQLLPVYEQFRQSLITRGIAYEGMLKRQVAERLQQEDGAEALATTLGTHIAIVGFNVLNETERRLFRFLKQHTHVHFYWDFDESYLRRDAEAGRFIRNNIELFGNELDLHADCYRQMAQPKQIEFIASPTENAQTRYVSQWLDKNHLAGQQPQNETAVVLCDENLLQPLLHAIPSAYTLNVTMGYPLQQTPISSFILSLLDLQLHGTAAHNTWRYAKVANVLKHPYAFRMAGAAATDTLRLLREKNMMFPSQQLFDSNDFLRLVFTPQTSNRELLNYLSVIVQKIGSSHAPVPVEDTNEETTNEEAAPASTTNEGATNESFSQQLYEEAVFNMHTMLNRLISLLDTGLLDVSGETLSRLLRQLIAAKTIPFHGEPAVGMQVMGLLETRNLDFRNLIMLSVNEGNLPKSDRRSSFIPYNLREAYGMTTIEKQNSLYAYYFYRLIQRAERVSLLYNNATDGLSKGEMSRFMMQWLVESRHPVGQFTLNAQNRPQSSQHYEAPKTEAVLARLKQHFSHHILSPTALKSYLSCPLQFYFKYAAGLRTEKEVSEEVGNDVFGNIFHYCMEVIYKQQLGLGHDLQARDILAVRDNGAFLSKLVDRAFNKEFFKTEDLDRTPHYSGEQLLNREVILTYVQNQLTFDAQLCPMSVLATEQDRYSMKLHVGDTQVRLGGIIDRIDRITMPYTGVRQLRIVDYKTSAKAQLANTIDELFDPDAKHDNGHILQAFYYSYILTSVDAYPGEPVASALMYVKKSAKATTQEVEPADCTIYLGKNQPVVDFAAQCKDEFHERLTQLVAQIFSPDESFSQRIDDNHCLYCDFRAFCGISVKKKDY